MPGSRRPARRARGARCWRRPPRCAPPNALPRRWRRHRAGCVVPLRVELVVARLVLRARARTRTPVRCGAVCPGSRERGRRVDEHGTRLEELALRGVGCSRCAAPTSTVYALDAPAANFASSRRESPASTSPRCRWWPKKGDRCSPPSAEAVAARARPWAPLSATLPAPGPQPRRDGLSPFARALGLRTTLACVGKLPPHQRSTAGSRRRITLEQAGTPLDQGHAAPPGHRRLPPTPPRVDPPSRPRSRAATARSTSPPSGYGSTRGHQPRCETFARLRTGRWPLRWWGEARRRPGWTALA